MPPLCGAIQRLSRFQHVARATQSRRCDIDVAWHDFAFLQVKEQLEKWQPLKKPQQHASLFQSWKELLETRDGLSRSYEHRSDADPYHHLVWETWMPPVRQAALYDCSPTHANVVSRREPSKNRLPCEYVIVTLCHCGIFPCVCVDCNMLGCDICH